jgi:hypothetical protein
MEAAWSSLLCSPHQSHAHVGKSCLRFATVKSESLRQVRDSGSGRRMGGACMSVWVNFAPKIAFNRGLVPRLQAIKTQPSSTTQLPPPAATS